MNRIKIILMIVVSVAVMLFVLRHVAPSVYHSIIKYSSRIIKGVIFATAQFIRYVKGNSAKAQTANSCRNKHSDCSRPQKNELDKLDDEVGRLKLELADKTSKYTTIMNEYDALKERLNKEIAKLDDCMKELKVLEKTAKEYQDKNKKLAYEKKVLTEQNEELKGRFVPVSKTKVSDVFCDEFEHANSCIGELEQMLYQRIEETGATNINNLLEYIQVKRRNDVNIFYGWYMALKYASSLIGDAAADISGCVNYDEQISYLKEKAFVRYYRPTLSGLILCMEHYRADSSDKRNWDDLIAYSIAELSKLKIDVNYVPTGAKYDKRSYENIVISVSETGDAPVGIVEKVVSIGVNVQDINVATQETEIIMNL